MLGHRRVGSRHRRTATWRRAHPRRGTHTSTRGLMAAAPPSSSGRLGWPPGRRCLGCALKREGRSEMESRVFRGSSRGGFLIRLRSTAGGIRANFCPSGSANSWPMPRLRPGSGGASTHAARMGREPCLPGWAAAAHVEHYRIGFCFFSFSRSIILMFCVKF